MIWFSKAYDRSFWKLTNKYRALIKGLYVPILNSIPRVPPFVDRRAKIHSILNHQNITTGFLTLVPNGLGSEPFPTQK